MATIEPQRTFSTAQMLAAARPGVPLSFEQEEQHSIGERGESGSYEYSIHAEVCRDSQGRVRQDATTVDDSGIRQSIRTFILDPTSNFALVSLPPKRVAYRVQLPSSSEAHWFSASALVDAAAGNIRWSVQIEEIESQCLNEIEFEGKRYVYSGDGAGHHVKTLEVWHSSLLHLTAKISVRDARCSYTVTIHNLRLGEPAMSLLSLPPDVEILELPFHP